jgi:hypothetical protein
VSNWRRAKQWSVFEGFRSGLNLPERWIACYNDPAGSGEPDVLLKTDQGMVGVELTEFFQDFHPDDGSLQERLYRQREDIVGRARELYRTKHAPPLAVQVFWTDHPELAKPVRTQTSISLEALVEAFKPPAGAPFGHHRVPWEAINRFGLDRIVAEVSIAPMPSGTTDWWHFSVMVWPFSPPAQIVRYIGEKESKLESYHRVCSEVWLIIHCMRGGMDVGEDVVNHEYATGFDRVFLLDEFSPRPQELKTTRGDARPQPGR